MIRRASRFFDRHPLLAVLAGIFVALVIGYLAVPDFDTQPTESSSQKGTA
ncbi:hypothetical protein [Burkholderia metallica]|nr:hypothetical protein [Burkholderia metallica]MCA8017772.1 hypothetical protein [Burkholderia metallica]